MNTFINIPQRGDVWLREVQTRKDCFIKLDTYDAATLSAERYEVLGAVAHVDEDGILVVYKDNQNQVFFDRCWWYLDGYTLDGTDRNGVISARFSTDNWTANVDKTIAYNATTMEQLVAQLNAAFAADSDFTKDDWEASIVDGKIRLTADASWQAFAYTTAKSGFTFPGGSAPEFVASNNMLRKNGTTSGGWAISNMDKAIQYLTADNVGFKPTSPVTNFKHSQPVCLPVYLGTSTAVAGDMCAYLRGIFGEGEEGWKNYLRCCEPVFDTQMGIFQVEDGKANTQKLAKMTYTSSTKSGVFSPAMNYAVGINTRTINAGELYAPSTKQLGRIMHGIKHGTTSSRQADVLNDCLFRIGGTAIRNNASFWSSCRATSSNAWSSYGNYGIFYTNSLSNSYGVVPVLHLRGFSHS